MVFSRAPAVCALLGLQILPLLDDRRGRECLARVGERTAVWREDVRVTTNELVGDGVDGVADREVSVLLGNPREKHGFEQEIAELLAQRVEVAAIERVEQLVGFLEHERPQRGERLLAIPRAAVGSAQRAHDVHEAIETASGGVVHAVEALWYHRPRE